MYKARLEWRDVEVKLKFYPCLNMLYPSDYIIVGDSTTVLVSYITMSLADALLADLDGFSDDGGVSDHEDTNAQASSSSHTNAGASNASPFGSMGPPPLPHKVVAGQKRLAAAMDGGMDDDDDDEDMEGTEGKTVGYVPEGGIRPAEELDAEDVENTDLTTVEDVGKVSKLMSGKRLKEIIVVGYS